MMTTTILSGSDGTVALVTRVGDVGVLAHAGAPRTAQCISSKQSTLRQ